MSRATTTVRITPETSERLSLLARVLGVSKAEAVTALTDYGITAVEGLTVFQARGTLAVQPKGSKK